MDVMELLEHDLTVEESRVERWFSMLKGALKPEKMYYISDAWVQGEELSVCFDVERKQKLEEIWDGQLTKLMAECSNVRCFPYHKLIGRLGEERAFSMKMWYLGKILHTNEAQKAMQRRLCTLVRWRQERLRRCCFWTWTIPCGEVWQEKTITRPLNFPRITKDWPIKICKE